VTLTKPRVIVMVVVTTIAGYWVGVTTAVDAWRVLHLAVGTLLAAGGTMALNQYRERDVDARMVRTRSRPLPERRLRPVEALAFGVAISVAGVVHLAGCLGLLAATVTAAVVVLYIFVYTPLKLRTPLCTVVGAVPGALPPVIGWVAARNDLGAGAWILFGILFFWQLPHALAIARLHRDDYARAGIRVLPVVDDGPRTERHILWSSVALVAVSVLATVAGVAGSAYLVTAGVLGAAFIAVGARQALAPSVAATRAALFASLVYLPALLTLLAVDKR
jgi:protoheme IX farnesyltransferase